MISCFVYIQEKKKNAKNKIRWKKTSEFHKKEWVTLKGEVCRVTGTVKLTMVLDSTVTISISFLKKVEKRSVSNSFVENYY